MKNKKLNKLARIENRFIFNARYQLNAREQKIILYLISNLNPAEQKEFHKQLIPVKELESILKRDNTKWGGLYKEMNDFSTRIISKFISFDSGFEIDGKPMKGVISWFQSILPVENDKGEVCLEFMFAENLKPFLLQLSEYAKIHPLDIAPMKSGFAIRMYQIFKAERDRKRKYEKITSLFFEIDELKARLGIEKKYRVLKDFRRRVLDVVIKEINLYSSVIKVQFDYVKTGRKVTGINFKIEDKTSEVIPIKEKSTPPPPSSKASEKDLNKLTWAQRKAFDTLVKFGVYEGIALKQIIPNIAGSEFSGYEDYFIQFAIKHFKKWSKQQSNKEASAGTFVVWWMEKKVFDIDSDVWSKILEQVVKKKKELQNKDEKAFHNREIAKKMTEGEFKEWYRSERGTDSGI